MRTRQVLLLLAVAFAIAGLVAGCLDGDSRAHGFLDHVLGVALVAGIYVWCRADMLRQSPPRMGRWALWSAVFAPVVLPIYLFRTRPPAVAIKSVAKGMAVYVGLTLVLVVAALGSSLFCGA
ncbi:hypothetical protein [Zoogloea sp.]|uniref:hypothetical protein n=1 Tax=Zoogloea sp. TaxID=49181 RepID=UPI001AD3974C|nr:hypothetical protein [Zoogloea sp.]MBN8285722.1 hypothetical protein [Zoogloea sp.]